MAIYNPQQLQVMKNVFEKVCADLKIPATLLRYTY
jgi:hypothetical protein